MQFRYDESKFTQMVLHVAARLRDDRAGGASKLDTVLFFADFAHVRRHGQPISGVEYQKLPHGPAPRYFTPVRLRLLARGDARLVTEDFLGYEQQRLVPLRAADLSVLDERERETLDSVLDDLAGLTSTQLADLLQAEPGWSRCKPGETIHYRFARTRSRRSGPPARRGRASAAHAADVSIPL
jgi:hypothetical protein